MDKKCKQMIFCLFVWFFFKARYFFLKEAVEGGTKGMKAVSIETSVSICVC